jgi:Response regulator containing CheY-like receiver, AAA-type ATPase, and DNA-binding domains
LIRQVLDFKLGLPVVLLIDKGTRLQISSAIQKMVTQCIEWPSVSPVFLAQLEKISTPKEPEQLAIINTAKTGLVGNSQGIRQVKELIVQVAASDATVLVLGESGTGKEVVAQALHRASTSKKQTFCAY